MKATATATDRIADAAVDQLCLRGAAGLTVADVAHAAGISSALVHYHFENRRGLLRAAAERLGAARIARRTQPLGGSGLDAIDALRLALEAEVDSGAERAWHDLLYLGKGDEPLRATVGRYRDAEAARLAERLPPLLKSLGAGSALAPHQLAAMVRAALDGFALALATGAARDTVRSAYDAFWLVVIGAGQSARP
jgi:AcrR family transcriptional regulator